MMRCSTCHEISKQEQRSAICSQFMQVTSTITVCNQLCYSASAMVDTQPMIASALRNSQSK
jgi:hypothetical protein